MTTESNPFAAPAAVSDIPGGLADDVEFLVSDKAVLFRDRVHLPDLCVQTGTTERLNRYSDTLYEWTQGGALLTRIFRIVAISTPILLILATVRGGLTISSNVIFILFLLCMIAFQIAAGRLRRKLEVSWCVSEDAESRWRQRRFNLLLGSIALTAAGGVWMSGLIGFIPDDLRGFGFPAVIAGFVLLSRSLRNFKRKPGQPMLKGKHEQLSILQGLSPEFLRGAQAIADRQ